MYLLVNVGRVPGWQNGALFCVRAMLLPLSRHSLRQCRMLEVKWGDKTGKAYSFCPILPPPAPWCCQDKVLTDVNRASVFEKNILYFVVLFCSLFTPLISGAVLVPHSCTLFYYPFFHRLTSLSALSEALIYSYVVFVAAE